MNKQLNDPFNSFVAFPCSNVACSIAFAFAHSSVCRLMKRARGHHQRAAELADATTTKSDLADWLSEQWAFGLMTATVVQKIAAMSEDDHRDRETRASTSPSSLSVLANMGSRGKHPSNIHQALTDSIQKKGRGMNVITEFEMPQKRLKVREKGPTTDYAAHQMINPFEWFGCMYK